MPQSGIIHIGTEVIIGRMDTTRVKNDQPVEDITELIDFLIWSLVQERLLIEGSHEIWLAAMKDTSCFVSKS